MTRTRKELVTVKLG